MRIPFALIALSFASAPLAAAEPVAGSWVTATKDGVVRIVPCGTALCGTLARFLVVPPQGADQRDVHNPDARLRSRKLLGMPILTGFREDGSIWRGTLEDFEHREQLARFFQHRRLAETIVIPLQRKNGFGDFLELLTSDVNPADCLYIRRLVEFPTKCLNELLLRRCIKRTTDHQLVLRGFQEPLP